MHEAIRSAVQALTLGDDAQRHFDRAAEHIQRSLLEVKIPKIPGVDIGVHAEPARLVGGDYIDIGMHDNVMVFGLGDASGKSLAAALHAMMLRYLVRGLLLSLGTSALASVLTHTNAVVTGDIQEDHFITFLLGSLDCETNVLRIVNGGHEPPLLLRTGEAHTRTIDRHGMVLGINADATYEHIDTELGPGDTVVMYTDGLTEATNERGELYTIARLEQYVVDHRDATAGEIADGIFASVKEHAGPELRDDATVLVVRMLAV